MTIIVETGVGVSGAVSYASVAEADAFLIPRRDARWIAASNDDKEGGLILGADYLNTFYLGGSIAFNPLGLSWPWVDVDVTAFDFQRIKRANIMLASIALLGPLWGAAQTQRVVSESKTLGPLSKSVTYAEVDAPASANGYDLNFVGNLLSGLASGGGLIIGTRGRA